MGVLMRWQFSARLTSVIVLAVISLAVGGAALGLALARGESAAVPEQVVSHMDKARTDTNAKAESRMFRRGDAERDSDRDDQSERRRVADGYERSKDGRGRAHDWRGSRRVIVVPRLDAWPHPFFRGDSPIMRRFERVMPERQVAPPVGMVIAVGEVTAVRDGFIEMFTVLGNEVTIDVSQLEAGAEPKVGSSAIVIAESDGDGYVAQSMDLLGIGLSEMPEGMRVRSRSAS